MSDLLKITTLGGLSIQLDGQPVRGFVSRKVEALLVYLAANPREHPREVLGELLWDDLPQNRTMSYLRTALSSLQQQLSAYLTVSRQTLSIDLESPIWLDVQVLEATLDDAEAEWQQRGSFSRITAGKLEDALELYKGHFLEGFHIRDASGFEGWMVIEQERIRNRVLEALHHLGAYSLQRGQYSSGTAQITRALQLDPLAEQAHRLMMLLLAQSGQRSAAIAQYETCRQILEDELGVEPEDETVELYERILAGEISMEAQTVIPHNLPTPATPFVDRPVEVSAIVEQLDRPECRLLTLIGPGGNGKTRLALRAAGQLLSEYPQGVFFVALAPITSPAYIVRTIANTLNMTFKGDAPLEDELIHYLHNQEMLLVLDNFDHLVEGADIISRILAGAPTTKMLITSRERLNLQEEWLYTVEALRVPASADDPSVGEYAAIQLFEQAAQRVQPDFSAAANIESLVRICQLVEGMPLGIELAASWTRMMTTQQIIREIEQGLDFLTTSLRNVPERHRSVRAVFDSSWNMLEEDEQQMLRQLSIFQGGFDSDSARTVTDSSIMTLSALVDKSMLSQVAGRYQIHELLRQYAARKLQEHPNEREQAQAALQRYFIKFLEDREGRLSNNRSDTAYSEVVREIDNIAAAWELALNSGDQAQIGRFLKPLYRLFDIQSRYLDGETLFRRAGEVIGASLTGPNNLIQARALLLRAACLQSMARYEEAEQYVTVAEPVFRAENAHWELRIALACLGAIVYARGEYRNAQAYYEETFDLVRRTGGEPVIILLRLSDIATILGEYEKARSILEQALSFLADSGGQHNRMRFLLTLGDINCKLGHFDEARINFQEALEHSKVLKATNSGGVAMVSLARVAFGTGEYAESRAYSRESIRMFEDIHNQWGKAFALIHLGRATQALDSGAEARHHYRSSLEIADQVGSPWLKSVALRQLGKSMIHSGEVETAYRHLREALQTAIDIQANPLVVDALAGIAEYYVVQPDADRAFTLASFLLNQPYSEYETLREAEAVIARVEPMMGDADREILRTAASNQTLNAIAAHILNPV